MKKKQKQKADHEQKRKHPDLPRALARILGKKEENKGERGTEKKKDPAPSAEEETKPEEPTTAVNSTVLPDADGEQETGEERKNQLPPQIRRLEMEKRIIMERISGTFNSADDVLFVHEIERIISGNDNGDVRELLMNMSTDSLVKLQDSYDPMMDLGGMLKRAAAAPRREAVLTEAPAEKEREEVCCPADEKGTDDPEKKAAGGKQADETQAEPEPDAPQLRV